MIQHGCVIAGEVENSTVLKGAIIESGASVSNCLIGENALIKSNAVLDGVVVGHGVIVPSNHNQTGGTF